MLLDKETIYLDNVTVYFWKIEESRKELEELCIRVLEKLKEVPCETIAMAKI